MDLALFTTRDSPTEPDHNDLHQIGSVKFAGEAFTRALAQKKTGPDGKVADREWQIRDEVLAGTSHVRYGQDPDANLVLTRLTTAAFEFLRIMIEAWRKEAGTSRQLKIVLVGNGWNLATAFDERAGAVGPREAFEQHYRDLVAKLDIDDVVLYGQDKLLADLPSSKHLAVMGAIRNARSDAQRQLEGKPEPSKLPCGRKMTFDEISFRWHDLVGDGMPLSGHDAGDLSTGGLNFNLNDLPQPSDTWWKRLHHAFRVSSLQELPYPTEEELREQIGLAVSGTPPIIRRGPVQIILETRWKDYLAE